MVHGVSIAVVRSLCWLSPGLTYSGIISSVPRPAYSGGEPSAFIINFSFDPVKNVAELITRSFRYIILVGTTLLLFWGSHINFVLTVVEGESAVVYQ